MGHAVDNLNNKKNTGKISKKKNACIAESHPLSTQYFQYRNKILL